MNSRGSSNERSEYLRNPDGSLRRDQFGRPIRMHPVAGSASQQSSSGQRFAQSGRDSSTPRQVFPAARPPVEETQILGSATSHPYGSSHSSPDDIPRQYIPRRPEESEADLYGVSSRGSRPYGRPDSRPQLHSPGPQLHSAARRQQRPPRRRQGCARSLGLLLIVVIVLAGVAALWADARLNRVDAMPDEHIGNTAGTNWMLVGSDSRAGLTDAEIEKYGTGGDMGGAGRTDTIMLLHIPTTGQAQLISIPRDSYVSIPGYGMDKINAAYSYGGSELLTQTVENATGLRIDHYAEIGMGGLAKLVDLVDGIQMCPEEPMNDPNANIAIDAGCQTFDGATALGYVRSRASGMGDLDRVKHQREFFSALMNTVTSTNTLANPGDILPLISHASGTFTVDSHDHVWDLARVALAMRSGVATETVPIGGFQDTDVGSVVLWDEVAAEELFAAIR